MKTSKDIGPVLSKAFNDAYLKEGFFDSIVSMLQGLENSWSGAAQNVDVSKIRDVPEDLNPKESVEDQISAAACVCQSVGYALSGLSDDINFLEESIEQLAEDLQTYETEIFIENSETFLENLFRAGGSFAGWLQRDVIQQCSSKVHDIGNDLDPGGSAIDVIKSINNALEKIDRLDIFKEAEKVLDQEKAKEILDSDDWDWAIDTIEESFGSFEKLDSIKEKLPKFMEDVQSLLDNLKEAGDAESLDQEAEPVKSSVFSN